MSLPDCMMPDGGEACAAYHELEQQLAESRKYFDGIRQLADKDHANAARLATENATLKAENDRLRVALELILKTLPDEFDDAMLWHVVTIAKQALGGSDE